MATATKKARITEFYILSQEREGAEVISTESREEEGSNQAGACFKGSLGQMGSSYQAKASLTCFPVVF